MDKIWKIMWWSALLPKIKTRWPSLRDPGNIHHPHFLRTLGHFHVMCAQLRPVGTTTSLGSVRRLPTRSAEPVSLDRPPLSPRLSARWTQCDDHLLRDHVRERCGQGERRRLMHLTRSGLAPEWPPWWKWLRNVIFNFSDHFCLIFSWKGRYPRPYSFFHKKDKTILFPTVCFFHTEWFLNSSK